MAEEASKAAERLAPELDSLLLSSGAEPDVARDGRVWLISQYLQPHRHYHNLSHIEQVLAAALTLGEADVLLQLAIWFHDSVYDPTRSDNEEQSALEADSLLSWLRSEDRERVQSLVLSTRDHVPHDEETAVLIDADLSILGASVEAYAAYASAIRQEYAFVPEDEFSKKRSAILERLLSRPSLYHGETAKRLWEVRARENVSQELRRLRF